MKVRFPNKETHLRGNVVERIRVQVLNGEQAAALVGDQGVCLQEDWLIEDHDPPTVIVVEDVKEGKDDEGKPQETGTARRLSALVAVRDRENKVVGVRGLVDEDGKEYKADLKEVRFVTEGRRAWRPATRCGSRRRRRIKGRGEPGASATGDGCNRCTELRSLTLTARRRKVPSCTR